MRRIAFSLAALAGIGSYGLAGGNIVPEETKVVDIVEPAAKTGFYLGAGYSCLQLMQNNPSIEYRSMGAVSLTAGYEFNSFLAVEGRYTASLGDIEIRHGDANEDYDWDMSNVAIYLKPKYSYNRFNVYGLLGYGQMSLDNGDSYSVSGLQFGGGFGVNMTDYAEVYIDYRRLYDDTDFDGLSNNSDFSSNSFTVGVNWHF